MKPIAQAPAAATANSNTDWPRGFGKWDHHGDSGAHPSARFGSFRGKDAAEAGAFGHGTERPGSRASGLKALLLLLLPALSGCLPLVHIRKVQAPKMPDVVLNADAADLVNSINKQYDSFQSLNAHVELQASFPAANKVDVEESPWFPGIILMRKPSDLRVLGLLPVLHTRAFDMASNGQTFKLYIPPKNKAIVGGNAVTRKSTNPLENLRPALFFDSLLLRRIDPNELVFLTTETRTTRDPKGKKLLAEPDYDLYVVHTKEDGGGPVPIHQLIPARVIHFSRVDLAPFEEDIYDQNGNIETQVIYGPYQKFGTTKYPGSVTIKRPLQQFQIVLTIQKLQLNQPLTDDQFELKIPEGVQVQRLD
jgi:outer membrane lipoprotein-sorting protein